ncbi:MAG: chemotaxis protein CheA [Rhodobacter sp.]|nr:chemotaxis protein CheA [Rhodobacter sp.]
MTPQSSIRDTFFEECEDLLEALAEGLAAMAGGARDTDTVNAVFRAVHSVKGGAGAFAMTDLVAFAHRFETVLDGVRSGTLDLTPEVMHTMQRSADHLADLVEAARNEDVLAADVSEAFLANLDQCLGAEPEALEMGDTPFDFAVIPLDFGDDPAPKEPAGHVIRFRPLQQLYANGHDPALLIAALHGLGPCEVALDLSALPDWEGPDALTPGLGWTLRLAGQESDTALQEIFEFVEGLCELDISPLEDAPAAVDPLPSVAAPPSPAPGPEAPSAAASAALKPDLAAGAESAEARGPKPTLRVDLDRVDRLINSVGELIINQAMIAQRLQDMALASDDDVSLHVEDYRLLARDIQEAVMAIRAQPVKPLFQRMSRILREAAEATGKSARLLTFGENTEVDKTVIERLADPLMHMIRNAVDHGLEGPDARRAAGKDGTGTIRLGAAHRSGSVIITIRDDGAGLNRPRILDIARRKGLVAPDADLADAEIDGLLFLPGFSTASSVSNLSGRGVGLDVVRNAVTALGGRISIASVPGQGTEFTISLPLTLAVMDGMVVSVAGQTMVVPITSILETIRPAPGDLHRVGTDDSLLSIRGRFIPTVDVARSLGFTDPSARADFPLLLLVEGENQSQCALVVDAVHDQRQVVIKGLDSNYGQVPGVSAATVLGDGQIALILDPDAIAAHRASPATSAAPRPPLFHADVHHGQH